MLNATLLIIDDEPARLHASAEYLRKYSKKRL